MSQSIIRSNNPVFKALRDGNVTLDHGAGSDRATINGILNKTCAGLVGLILVAAASYAFIPIHLLYPLSIISALATFVVAAVAAVRHNIGVGVVAAYVLLEGVFLGAVSKSFDTSWPGIASHAMIATMIVAVLVFLVHRFGAVRMSGKVMRFIGIATMAMAGLYLVNLLLVIFHVNTGLVNAGPHAGLLSYAISAIAIVLATANLLMDFDSAEAVVASGASSKEEWRVAFGLLATLAWMYVELLRILSYFQKN